MYTKGIDGDLYIFRVSIMYILFLKYKRLIEKIICTVESIGLGSQELRFKV
jgi:hypothetical protein